MDSSPIGTGESETALPEGTAEDQSVDPASLDGTVAVLPTPVWEAAAPDVGSLTDDVLFSEEARLNSSMTLPVAVVMLLKTEAERRGETQRTILLRWLMKAGLDIHPGWLVDQRARVREAQRRALREKREQLRQLNADRR
jgi:hypothetical protein